MWLVAVQLAMAAFLVQYWEARMCPADSPLDPGLWEAPSEGFPTPHISGKYCFCTPLPSPVYSPLGRKN